MKNDICTTQISFFIGWKLSQGHFLAYKNLLHQTNNLSTLASGVARSTDLIQSAPGFRQFQATGQRPLSRGLACAIDIKDDGATLLPIEDATNRLWCPSLCQGVLLEEQTEGFQTLPIQSSQEPAQT